MESNQSNLRREKKVSLPSNVQKTMAQISATTIKATWPSLSEIHNCIVTLRIMVKMHLNAIQRINQPYLPVRESQMVQRVSLALYWTTKFIVAFKVLYA